MGNYCKSCEPKNKEIQNEIIHQNGDLVQASANKRNLIKNSFILKYQNIDDFLPKIILLQRNIKKYLSQKKECERDLFYKKYYSNNINLKLNEDFDIIVYNDDEYDNSKGNKLGKHSSDKSEKFKTLSQKYNTISNNSLTKSKNDGKIYKVDKFQINDFAVYSGDMLNGKQHGHGIQEWKDGARYEGEWENGKTNGYGTFYHIDGDIYKGYWKDDKANGKGVYTSKEGVKYDGEWVNDCQEGYGIETWSDGSEYKGNYKNGKKDGYGEYFWSDGSQYSGYWVNNNQEGQGKYIWPDKKSYEGSFKNNKLQGLGHYKWPDGRDFVGQFNNGKKYGLGRYIWPDGRVYTGFWENGKQEGLGLYQNENHIKRFGVWVNGKRNRWLNEETINSFKENNDEYYQQIIDLELKNNINNCLHNESINKSGIESWKKESMLEWNI